MSRRPPPDPEAIVADRVDKHRAACLQVVARSLGEFGFAEVPHEIGEAINRALWACVNEGKHYAHLRNTVRQDPPAPDRVKTPVRDLWRRG